MPPAVEAAWGDRLYGCDACSDACPRAAASRARRVEAERVLGDEGAGPGYRVPVLPLLGATDAAVRARFAGTALGMRWIEPAALRRNALLALAAAGPRLLPPGTGAETGRLLRAIAAGDGPGEARAASLALAAGFDAAGDVR